MIMRPTEHNAKNNTLPWIDPQNPGALTLGANITACQMAIANDTQQCNKEECDTFRHLTSKLKAQLIQAVDDTFITKLKDEDLDANSPRAGQLTSKLGGSVRALALKT
jgi:hypothetical protein